MKYVNVDLVEPGDVLARSIYTSEGLTLLHTGVQLTVGMINKLRRFGVTMLSIKDPLLDEVKEQEVVTETTRKDAIRNLSQAISCVQTGKNFDVRGIQKSVGSIIDETLRNRRVLLNLGEIRTTDNAMYIHSLNVCMMATVMGVGLGYNTAQLKELAIGALLHDIGKLSVDKEAPAYKKNSKTNHHTWLGFDLLRKKHEMSIVSAHVPLQHHEWVDGSGQPRGLTGDEIHDFAKIVAICNYYDNLISPFSEEEETLPAYEACEKVMGFAEKRFDHKMVIHFLRSIALYPTGTSLKLSTGEIGVIIDQNRGLPSRPVVRVIRRDQQANRRMVDDHEITDIDLSEKPTIFITAVMD
ncbi:HD-GYP domain-containing protein [Brevibacillus sp. DP1.3A]|uniref:HD-GYP domain-containing protein n=1 Tax=unclassified Brevibacillus TaxID=2684853 RepID=UPI00156A9BC5|nr:HD domain-containing phosphohydrolase [Brevibacillus sp. DP1.3A]MED1917304.1 HD domain-containing protein [Bacillus thuringiensis]UED72983.1 HD domain-containing protein [Brevibacillus sp. DP1.3A]